MTQPTLIEFDTVTLNSSILESLALDYKSNNFRMSALQLPKSKKLITVLKKINLVKNPEFKFKLRNHQFNLNNINELNQNTCIVLAEESVEEEECRNYLKTNLF